MANRATKKTEWVTNDFGHTYTGEICFQGKSRFQRMEIFRNRTFGTLLFLDNKIQISEKDENRYHQYLVAAPLLAHPRPNSICIIGGGDCFSLEEAIKHTSLKRILMLEIDSGVVEFCTQHYPMIKQVRKDKRIEIIYTDAGQWLENTTEKFDILIVDLTEPHGPSKMLYTREFYRICQQHLTSQGLLSLHTDNHSLFPESYATIYKTLSSVFPNILTARVDMPCFGMGWTFRLASEHPISYPRLVKNVKKFKNQGHTLDQFTPTTYLVEPTPEEEKVIRKYGRISTAANPFDKFAKMNQKVTC